MLKGVDRIRSSRLTRLPNASKLAQLGVRRLSAGSAIPQVIWQHVAHLTEAFFADGDSSLFTKDYIDHAQFQNLFTPR